jgi:hypothetical protein
MPDLRMEPIMTRTTTTDLATRLHAAYTATRALWLDTRLGGQPAAVAGPAATAYASAERAVSEARKAGLVDVDYDLDGVVTAIRPPGGAS